MTIGTGYLTLKITKLEINIDIEWFGIRYNCTYNYNSITLNRPEKWFCNSKAFKANILLFSSFLYFLFSDIFFLVYSHLFYLLFILDEIKTVVGRLVVLFFTIFFFCSFILFNNMISNNHITKSKKKNKILCPLNELNIYVNSTAADDK